MQSGYSLYVRRAVKHLIAVSSIFYLFFSLTRIKTNLIAELINTTNFMKTIRRAKQIDE